MPPKCPDSRGQRPPWQRVARPNRPATHSSPRSARSPGGHILLSQPHVQSISKSSNILPESLSSMSASLCLIPVASALITQALIISQLDRHNSWAPGSPSSSPHSFPSLSFHPTIHPSINIHPSPHPSINIHPLMLPSFHPSIHLVFIPSFLTVLGTYHMSYSMLGTCSGIFLK